MKLTKYLFGACMAGTFALSVIGAWLYVPAPPPEFEGAAAVICAAVIAFCTGVLCFGLGSHLQQKEIGDRIIAELRDQWAGIPTAARCACACSGATAGGGEDDEKPMRRAYAGE